ncbi:MAG: ABC transporter ATP-binding protein [Planctomycetota bacterium]
MPAEPHIIELDQIVKSYGTVDDEIEVLHGVNLIVEPREFLAIVGPSGSGKSTLLNILGCLDRPTSGAYRFVGEDVAKFDDDKLSRIRNRRIGFIFQSFQLVSHLTVIENIELPLFYARMPKGRRREKCRKLIERVGLSHRMTHRPNQLSGGEKQRVAVARALSNDPDLLLADEPTGNLDTATSAEIMRLFAELHDGGATIVMITHDMEIAESAPRRVTIRDGLIGSSESRTEFAS